VLVLPTVNCLVELTQMPFTVVSLGDIEIINLERVGFNLKNFDMAIVFKVRVVCSCVVLRHVCCVVCVFKMRSELFRVPAKCCTGYLHAFLICSVHCCHHERTMHHVAAAHVQHTPLDF
jgi:hypothetical protein